MSSSSAVLEPPGRLARMSARIDSASCVKCALQAATTADPVRHDVFPVERRERATIALRSKCAHAGPQAMAVRSLRSTKIVSCGTDASMGHGSQGGVISRTLICTSHANNRVPSEEVPLIMGVRRGGPSSGCMPSTECIHQDVFPQVGRLALWSHCISNII